MTVYVIRRKGDNSGLVKIGFTKNTLRSRLSNMSTSAPEGFDVLHELEGDIDLETTLHKIFEGKRENREWFRLDEADLSSIPAIRSEPQGRREQHIPSAADVDGQSIVFETRFYLNELVKREWRGFGDSVESARDRVMEACDLSPSYGFRLWHKYTELKDVSGEAYRCLRLSYAMKRMEEGKLDEAQARFVYTYVRSFRDIPGFGERKGFGQDFIRDLVAKDWRPAA